MGKTHYIEKAMDRGMSVFLRPPHKTSDGEYATPDMKCFPQQPVTGKIKGINWQTYYITVKTETGDVGLVWPYQITVGRRVRIQQKDCVVEVMSLYDFHQKRYQDEDPEWLSTWAKGTLLGICGENPDGQTGI